MNLNSDLACDLVLKLRRLQGKSVEPDHGEASNETDDDFDASLRADNDKGVKADITGLLAGLNTDEVRDLAALIMWGRDDSLSSLDAARERADRDDRQITEYVFQEPLSGEHLRAGLDKAGIACDGMDGSVRITS